MSHHKRVADFMRAGDQPVRTTVAALGVLLIALAVFGFPAFIWAAITFTFPTIGLTYWQTLALYIAFRVATLHLQPVRAKKAAQ